MQVSEKSVWHFSWTEFEREVSDGPRADEVHPNYTCLMAAYVRSSYRMPPISLLVGSRFGPFRLRLSPFCRRYENDCCRHPIMDNHQKCSHQCKLETAPAHIATVDSDGTTKKENREAVDEDQEWIP